jgi:hypothetical protein
MDENLEEIFSAVCRSKLMFLFSGLLDTRLNNSKHSALNRITERSTERRNEPSIEAQMPAT